MFIERQYPVLAVIRDVADKTRQPFDKLRITVFFVTDPGRTHVDLELQTMKRMRPSVHLRVEECVRAARTEACDVNVMVDELLRIDVVEGTLDEVGRSLAQFCG
jgi:hypothetical protein